MTPSCLPAPAYDVSQYLGPAHHVALQAYIRFKETGKAADAVKKVVEDKREVKGKVPEFKLLQDQEEKVRRSLSCLLLFFTSCACFQDYWIKLEDERKASRKMKRETKHKRKGGRGAKRGHNQN